MKNNGVLKLFLVLVLCGVVSVYALTAGSVVRLHVDVSRVQNILYCENLQEGTDITIDNPEYVEQIVTVMNQLELQKTEFKIKRDEMNKMSCITFGYYDGVNVETFKIGSIILMPDNRLMLNWGNKSGCYNASHEELSVLLKALGRKTIETGQYVTGEFMIAFPESMLE